MKLTFLLFLSAVRCLWQRQGLEDLLYLISPNHMSFAVIVRLLPQTLHAALAASQPLAWLSCCKRVVLTDLGTGLGVQTAPTCSGALTEAHFEPLQQDFTRSLQE